MLEVIQGKVEVTGQIGEKTDEALAQAEREAHQREGATAAFAAAAKAVASLHKHVDEDRDADKLPVSFDSELEAASYIKKWITRGVELCLNLKERSQSETLVANGKVVALKDAVAIVQRYHDTAVSRVKQLTAPDEEPDDPETEDEVKERRRARKSGEHPGPSRIVLRKGTPENGTSGPGQAVAKKAPTKKKKAPTKKKTTKKKAPAKRK